MDNTTILYAGGILAIILTLVFGRKISGSFGDIFKFDSSESKNNATIKGDENKVKQGGGADNQANVDGKGNQVEQG